MGGAVDDVVARRTRNVGRWKGDIWPPLCSLRKLSLANDHGVNCQLCPPANSPFAATKFRELAACAFCRNGHHAANIFVRQLKPSQNSKKTSSAATQPTPSSTPRPVHTRYPQLPCTTPYHSIP